MRHTDPDPLQEIVGVQQRMNRLFERALARTNFEAEGGIGAWSPVADVVETEDEVVFWLEVPGLDQKDLNVRVEDDALLVAGVLPPEREEPSEQFHRIERSSGRFSRRFPLPSGVDATAIDARYQQGVLRISAPKRDSARAGAIRVPVR